MPQRKTSELIVKGEGCSIEAAICSNESIPALEYYESLSERDQAKFFYLFKLMAQMGQIRNTEKFRHLEDGIFEFKAKPYRILCFWTEGRKLILTNGFLKQSQRIRRRDLDLSKTIRQDYLQAQKEGRG